MISTRAWETAGKKTKTIANNVNNFLITYLFI